MHYTFGASAGPAGTAVAVAAAAVSIVSHNIQTGKLHQGMSANHNPHAKGAVLAARTRRNALGDVTNGFIAGNTQAATAVQAIKRSTGKDHPEGNEDRQKRQKTSKPEEAKRAAETEKCIPLSSAQAAVRARFRVKLAQQQTMQQPKRPAWNQHQPAQKPVPVTHTQVLAPPAPSAKPKHPSLKSAAKPTFLANAHPHTHNLRDSTKIAPSLSVTAPRNSIHHASTQPPVTSRTGMDIDADSHRHHNHSHLPKTIHQSNLSSHAIEAAVKPSVSVFNPRLTQPRPAEDPLLVSEYSEEIFGYMRQMELKTLPNAKYILSQPGITWEMRRMLVDWLLSLHQKLRLLPETLFLTINLLDRFMSLKVVSVEKFQLVGITAMFIACKYEEIMVPSVQVMVHMVEGGYSSDEILKAEKFMLGLLKFGIGYNGPCSFLKRGLLAEKPLDVRCVLLAKYFCDVALLDHLFVAVGGSLIAASAIYLGKKILNNGDWTAEHVSLTGYSENQVVECAKALYNSVSLIGVDAGVYLKYADAKYSHVATYVKEFTLKNIAT